MMTHLTILLFMKCLVFVCGSHHWIVTEGGRIEPKLDSAFPVHRPYDLLSVLEQEQRVQAVTEMHRKLSIFKQSVDQQWSAIELETEFEKRLYVTDPNCMYAGHPLSRYRLSIYFMDYAVNDRIKLPQDRLNEKPPDCKKFHQLDFSLLTFPHLKTMREHENFTGPIGDVESDAPLDVDLTAMLTKNSSDWTAYNLAVHYWQIHDNASNAIECARRAIYFAPREFRFLALFNLGTLLQAMHSLGEAAIVLHMAVDMDRGQYHSHVALGHVYSFLDDYPRAAGCYRNALSLRPDLIMLAKQRAAVLCRQRLITGLWAMDAALKRLVEELQEYSQLQERWVVTHTQIGLERACGGTTAPSPDNLRTLWKAVEHQALLLSERMTQAKPGMNNAIHNSEGKGKYQDELSVPPEKHQRLQFSKTDTQNNVFGSKCKASNERREEEEEKTFRRKFNEFHSFMTDISVRYIPQRIMGEKIIEKLVSLEGNYVTNEPKGSPYWDTLKKCINLLDEQVLPDECGQQIFAEYLQLSEKSTVGEQPEDLLDESIIENYVHERNILGSDAYHDLSEL